LAAHSGRFDVDSLRGAAKSTGGRLNAGGRGADGTSMTSRPSLLLAHHRPEQHERCALVAGRPVCRRCLVLYPLLLLAIAATALGATAPVPAGWREALLWLLPLPAAVEYTLEAFDRVRYSPHRQVAVTVPQAVAGGAGFAWEWQAPATVSFWTAVAVYGTAGLVVTAAGWRATAARRARTAYREALAAAEQRVSAG
jgi:hypothetical protein